MYIKAKVKRNNEDIVIITITPSNDPRFIYAVGLTQDGTLCAYNLSELKVIDTQAFFNT